MNNKLIILFAASMLMLIGCKKITVDFTYSPAKPKAGETVRFTNLSSAGESWQWSFGDNATIMLKNPNKIYKRPGDYIVTLMVDSAKNQTCSKVITIYDTVPTFACLSEKISHYQDVAFKAYVYNPFNYTLKFKWTLPENCVIVSGDTCSSVITVYFTTPGKANIQLTINQKDKEFQIQQEYTVDETKAPAIVMQLTDKTVVRQRIISNRLEQATAATSEDAYLIEQTTDTIVTFNGKTFLASQMADSVEGFAGLTINRMQIDASAQKWYITTADGLFVANIDGTHLVSLDSTATGAIYVNAKENTLYWATGEGLKTIPLIKSKYNLSSDIPTLCNALSNIDLITVNNTPL